MTIAVKIKMQPEISLADRHSFRTNQPEIAANTASRLNIREVATGLISLFPKV